MKHLKTYESIEKEPQIGDFIICKEYSLKKEISDFISTNIGKIISDRSLIHDYTIKYQNVPKDLKPYFSYHSSIFGPNCRGIDKENILFFSPDKETIETYLQANKYNIWNI